MSRQCYLFSSFYCVFFLLFIGTFLLKCVFITNAYYLKVIFLFLFFISIFYVYYVFCYFIFLFYNSVPKCTPQRGRVYLPRVKDQYRGEFLCSCRPRNRIRVAFRLHFSHHLIKSIHGSHHYAPYKCFLKSQIVMLKDTKISILFHLHIIQKQHGYYPKTARML